MIISRKWKFVFIHIKKTAGSSITRALSGYDDRSWHLKVFGTKPLERIHFLRRFNPFWHHVSACELIRHLGPEYQEYYSFAFVRNPFDWQVSNYFYIKQHPLHPRYREVKDMEFSDYLSWTRLNGRIQLQSDFVVDCERSQDLAVSFIGKFKNLAEDFNHIISKIGLSSELQLDLYNASKRSGDYRKYYSKTTINFIEKYYEEDLNRFGYEY